MSDPKQSNANLATTSDGALPGVQFPRANLVKSLTYIVENCPLVAPWKNKFRSGEYRGIFTGPTSIALIFLHLSRTYTDMIISARTPEQWCAVYISLSAASVPPFNPTADCGITNEHLAFHAVAGAFNHSSAYLKALLSAANQVQPASSNNEYWSGRAGLLYFLRLARASTPSSRDDIDAAMKPLIYHIMSSRPWASHGRLSLGAVHGQIGILTQVVLSDPSTASELEDTLVGILEQQKEKGHWPVNVDGDPTLVQFCHGAPGVVLSLVALRPHFPGLEKRIDYAIILGRKAIWEEGILVKEPNLCHGTIGNALALEGKQRDYFMHLASPEKIEAGIQDGSILPGDDPFGLLWGEAGRAWGWACLDRPTQFSGMIGYTDIN